MTNERINCWFRIFSLTAKVVDVEPIKERLSIVGRKLWVDQSHIPSGMWWVVYFVYATTETVLTLNDAESKAVGDAMETILSEAHELSIEARNVNAGKFHEG